MTCDCNWRAELAEILRDTGGPIGIATWATALAARLAPAPSPASASGCSWCGGKSNCPECGFTPPDRPVAATAEGWREKCSIIQAHDRTWNVFFESDKNRRYYLANSRWHGPADYGNAWGDFPTRAAAVAALAAAEPPPGVTAATEPAKPASVTPCSRCGTTLPSRPFACPKCKVWNEAEGGFDAEAVAERMVPRDYPPRVCGLGAGALAVGLRDDDGHGAGRADMVRTSIAAALDAAHKAGREAGRPRRWPEGRPVNTARRIMRWNRKYHGWDIVGQHEIEDGALWVETPPAPGAGEVP